MLLQPTAQANRRWRIKPHRVHTPSLDCERNMVYASGPVDTARPWPDIRKTRSNSSKLQYGVWR